MKNYRLEYSEKQGGFHYDDGMHEENTFGWITICSSISIEQCNEFVEVIYEKYPSTDWANKDRGDENFTPLTVIQAEFEKFLLSTPKYKN